MLHIKDLRVEKAGKTILRVADLFVGRGERVAVIGPNGSGKTTLLRVASGLETQFTGQCQADAPVHDRVYAHQSPYLFRGTALFNAGYGLTSRRSPRRERISIARRWLTHFGVEHLADRQCASLSGGERRRVALARAFATQAELLLLDEPLADLDKEGVAIVRRALSSRSNSTILLTSPVPLPNAFSVQTHHLEEERP